MKNATISTSRTRATTTDDSLIEYRPLSPSWGDMTGLRALRFCRARSARRGADPSVLGARGLRP